VKADFCGRPTRATTPNSAKCARIALTGIDTLTSAVGRNAPRHGSGCKAALPPDDKSLGPKRFEDAARKEVALDIEGVLDGGVDCEEALG